MKIGLIDSGKGGLAVAKALNASGHSFVVVMDEAFFPYGNKSKNFLCARAFYLVQFLIKQNVDMILLACNTLSLSVLPFLKESMSFPIEGIFQYLEGTIHQEGAVLLGSAVTCFLAKQRYPDLTVMDGGDLIAAIQYQKNIAEELKKINEQLKSYGCVLLACTHFLMLDEKDFCIPVISPISFVKKALLQKEKELRLGSS